MAWRVLTWNILGAKSPDIAALATHVRGCSPDVVTLQEARRSQARNLAEALGYQVLWKRKHYPLTPLLAHRAEGQAILSPHRLAEPTGYVLSPNVSTWSYRHRIMVCATVVRAADRLRVYNVHLSSNSPDERIAQARLAASRIAAEDHPLRVVGGDLNAAHEQEVLREFHAVAVRDTGGEVTNPAHVPHQRLDYVLVPEDAMVSSIETPEGGDDWAALSDHLPVLVEFSTEGFGLG